MTDNAYSTIPRFYRPRFYRAKAWAKAIALVAFAIMGANAAFAQENGGRKGTGLPVPRYVSLKTDPVNLREGPSKDNRTVWVFQRVGLPVEIVAEYENWRRIRDSEGTDGWVLHSLLSGRRTALVTPWAKEKPGKDKPALIALLGGREDSSGTVARLEPGVIVTVKSCDTTWCEVTIPIDNRRDLSGYIRQDKLWGVYPGEKVE